MATIDLFHMAEYKFCALNGAPLHLCRQGSLSYDLKSMTFTVEQFVTNEDGNFLVFDFAGKFGGKSEPEVLTEKITRPIIALPHELKGML